MVVVDILGEILVLEVEVVAALGFYIFFVGVDDGVGEEVGFLVELVVFNGMLLFVSDELGVVLFALLEILGVETGDETHFLYCVYLSQLVHVLEPFLFSHLFIIIN